MVLLVALAIGLGAGGFAYSKMGRRLGYENTANVWTIVGVAFFIGFLIAYTFLKFVLGLS